MAEIINLQNKTDILKFLRTADINQKSEWITSMYKKVRPTIGSRYSLLSTHDFIEFDKIFQEYSSGWAFTNYSEKDKQAKEALFVDYLYKIQVADFKKLHDTTNYDQAVKESKSKTYKLVKTAGRKIKPAYSGIRKSVEANSKKAPQVLLEGAFGALGLNSLSNTVTSKLEKRQEKLRKEQEKRDKEKLKSLESEKKTQELKKDLLDLNNALVQSRISGNDELASHLKSLKNELADQLKKEKAKLNQALTENIPEEKEFKDLTVDQRGRAEKLARQPSGLESKLESLVDHLLENKVQSKIKTEERDLPQKTAKAIVNTENNTRVIQESERKQNEILDASFDSLNSNLKQIIKSGDRAGDSLDRVLSLLRKEFAGDGSTGKEQQVKKEVSSSSDPIEDLVDAFSGSKGRKQKKKKKKGKHRNRQFKQPKKGKLPKSAKVAKGVTSLAPTATKGIKALAPELVQSPITQSAAGGLSKVGGVAKGLLGKAGPVALGALALYDAYKGFDEEKADSLGFNGKTTKGKTDSAISSVVDNLTFGLIDEKLTAGILKGVDALQDGLVDTLGGKNSPLGFIADKLINPIDNITNGIDEFFDWFKGDKEKENKQEDKDRKKSETEERKAKNLASQGRLSDPIAASALSVPTLMADKKTDEGKTREELEEMDFSTGDVETDSVSSALSMANSVVSQAVLSATGINASSSPPVIPNVQGAALNESDISDGKPISKLGDVKALLEYGAQFIGRVSYSMTGPRDPRLGSADCSSFVRVCLLEAWGVKAPSTSEAQFTWNRGKVIKFDELKPGDLMFFNHRAAHAAGRQLGISHVGFYFGDNKILHCSSSGKGVNIMKLSPSYITHFYAGKRLTESGGSSSGVSASPGSSGSVDYPTGVNGNPVSTGYSNSQNIPSVGYSSPDSIAQSDGSTPYTSTIKAEANGGLDDVIGQAESNNSYGAYNESSVYAESQGRKARGGMNNNSMTEMSLEEVIAKQAKGEYFAVGRYQVVPDVLKAAAKELGLDPKAKFSKEMQDKIFAEYLIKKKRPKVDKYITGQSEDLEGAALEMAKEWASIATKGGSSFYDKDGRNKAHISYPTIVNALQQARLRYSQSVKEGKSSELARVESLGLATDSGQSPITEQMASAANKTQALSAESTYQQPTPLVSQGYTSQQQDSITSIAAGVTDNVPLMTGLPKPPTVSKEKQMATEQQSAGIANKLNSVIQTAVASTSTVRKSVTDAGGTDYRDSIDDPSIIALQRLIGNGFS